MLGVKEKTSKKVKAFPTNKFDIFELILTDKYEKRFQI